ncbi:LptE family protein [Mucilaginibacter sp. AW1-3]
MKYIFYSSVIVLLLFSQSCSIKLTGSSIPLEMKTIDVEFFDNNAPLVVNNLSQNFTEALKNKIRSETKLRIVRTEDADAVLSGSITGYSIAPAAVQAPVGNAPPQATLTRLSITVSVKYVVNLKDPAAKGYSYETSFVRFKDYAGDLSTQEQALIADINKQLTEDIFNKAFANW